MKSTIISMLIVLMLMIVVPMVLFGDNEIARNFGFGRVSNDDAVEDLKDKVPKNIQAVVTDKEVEVYKWTDEHGVMQFSSLPPYEGIASERMLLSPKTNVIDAIKIPKKEEEKIAKPQVFSLGSPYSPGGMKKMVDDSKALTEKLNTRQTEQDAMMQEMFKQN